MGCFVSIGETCIVDIILSDSAAVAIESFSPCTIEEATCQSTTTPLLPPPTPSSPSPPPPPITSPPPTASPPPGVPSPPPVPFVAAPPVEVGCDGTPFEPIPPCADTLDYVGPLGPGCAANALLCAAVADVSSNCPVRSIPTTFHFSKMPFSVALQAF